MESSAGARYQRFFGAYQQVKQGASDTHRSKIAQFMGQVAPFVRLQKEVRRQTAARFNLFEALGMARKEQVQSRFLAFLLDPAEKHVQGDLFLRTFLEHMLPKFLQQPLDRTVVQIEQNIATCGRVDIQITLPDGRIIAIENKVDASEGEEQIVRYQAGLSQPHGQPILVFLTPDGREPRTGDPTAVLCRSYRQLGNWVCSLLRNSELPERLRTVLIQYRENCHIIGGDRRYGMAMDDELHAFLTDPPNLDTVLGVAEAVETIRREVFKQFWGRVKEQLSLKLQHHGYQRQWEVYSDDDIFAPRDRGYPCCGIYWRASDSRFAVTFDSLIGTRSPAYYGIWRGRAIPTRDRDGRDRALSDQLKAENLMPNQSDAWVGWRYLHDLGLPEFRVTKKEDVLLLNEDNRDPNHPLAHKLASLLWEFFDRHREALEDLNANYPY